MFVPHTAKMTTAKQLMTNLPHLEIDSINNSVKHQENVHKLHGYFQTFTRWLTAILQSTIVSIANASCTTIGPPLLKSRPTLQAQVSKIKKIRVPDRGLKAAGAA
ncbi:hypothetical protein TNCV_4602051 [Trichonephila clavipes]|nr:hypothetical protein TNCV_4602051 [Trichonephila clavipes]